jgi:V8-like Glu-specific endopeptidase
MLEECIGMVTFYWYDKKTKLTSMSQGSGFLISKDKFLTASHNLYRTRDSKKCTNCIIELIPKG